MAIPLFDFYRDTYHGISIPEGDWARIATRADEQLVFFARTYTVADLSGDGTAWDMALCAIADQMYTYETVMSAEISADANGGVAASSVSIGSVSASVKTPNTSNLGLDMSETGQTKAFYRIAQRYLDIYRGVGGCRR